MRALRAALGSLAVMLLVSVAPAIARADSNDAHLRLGVSGGTWDTSFYQEGSGQRAALDGPLALGGELRMGVEGGPVFLEYSATFLTATNFSAGISRGSAYWASPLGGVIGIRIPLISSILPTEVFGGYESGRYGFTNGSKAHFDGRAWKAGASIYFRELPKWRLGLTATYRWMIFKTDESGDIPAAYHTGAHAWMAGIVFQLRPPF